MDDRALFTLNAQRWLGETIAGDGKNPLCLFMLNIAAKPSKNIGLCVSRLRLSLNLR